MKLVGAAVALLATSVSAFQGTAPLIAWSSSPSADLSALVPPALAYSSQLPLTPLPHASLCPSSPSPASLLVISVPEFKELRSLPPSVKQRYGGAAGQARLKMEFVDEKQGGAIVQRVLAAWEEGCAGEAVVKTIDGMDEIEPLIASSSLVILTGLPLSSLTPPSPSSHLTKRHLPIHAITSRRLPSDDLRDFFAPNSSKNGTMPDPNSGLLVRYRFFSTYLLVSLGVFVGILIPAVLLGSHALTQIEAPHGLNNKMSGSIGEVKS